MPSPADTPDLAELRTFCLAADLGSVGRAAVRLRVSQPTLSRRLQSLEDAVGTRLLDRSRSGVTLTPDGRRLYEHARRLLAVADEVGEVIAGIKQTVRVVRLASSHSTTEAFVARMLAGDGRGPQPPTVELVSANSQVVRGLVSDGRADLGVAASRPGHTPNPGVREDSLADDAIVCGVPPGHRWASRARLRIEEFLAEPMVVRDPSSNARWTVDAVLRSRGLQAAPPVLEAPTPRSALSEARGRRAPVLLSRHILAQSGDFKVLPVEDLEFPRRFVLVTPAFGRPTGEVAAVADHIRDQARIWLR